MLILIIRTDNPQAEVGLFDAQTKLAYQTWYAHRELSVTIHKTISKLLKDQNKTIGDIQGLVVYEGPGSFTGLRIGISVANALAYAVCAPVVASGGENWAKNGIARLQAGGSDPLALPHYGAPVHITRPKR